MRESKSESESESERDRERRINTERERKNERPNRNSAKTHTIYAINNLINRSFCKNRIRKKEQTSHITPLSDMPLQAVCALLCHPRRPNEQLADNSNISDMNMTDYRKSTK